MTTLDLAELFELDDAAFRPDFATRRCGGPSGAGCCATRPSCWAIKPRRRGLRRWSAA